MTQRLTELPVRELVERLSTADPTPGGGSAAALAGCVAAALVEMVVALTTGRPQAAEHEEALDELRAAARAARIDLIGLVEADAAAYQAVIDARRLPRGTDGERRARDVQVATATREATRVPLETVRRAGQILELADRLAPIGNRHAASDVGVAALLAAAAMRSAAYNVRINLPYLSADDGFSTDAKATLDRLMHDLDDRELRVRAAAEARIP